jgi:hypothetical protein
MTRPWARVDPAEYRGIELRAHELLARVPVHDVWRVDLPHAGGDYTIEDVRTLLTLDSIASINPAVRGLFALRGWLGRAFRLDRDSAGEHSESYLRWLTPDDCEESLVEPGTPDPPFTVLYVRPYEAVSEIRNRTVHAFSVLAMQPRFEDCRVYWAIHVLPVGRLTPLYMALIDPFRRWIVYPSVLRNVHRQWCERLGA